MANDDARLESARQVEEFDLVLPLRVGEVSHRQTHIVAFAGDQHAFLGALRDRMDADGAFLAYVAGPIGRTSLGQLADLLNTVGPAAVQSIDRL